MTLRDALRWAAMCAGVSMAACGGATTSSATPAPRLPTTATPSLVSTPAATVAATPTPPPHGVAAVNLQMGAPAVKIAMTGDNTDPSGARFVPSAVSVKVGQVVEWDFDPNGYPGHNIVFANDPGLSNRLGLGAKPNGTPGDGTWQVRFGAPGAYDYVCTYHLPTMTGAITVTP